MHDDDTTHSTTAGGLHVSDEKYLTKLAALLRQAESTDNEHEAEAFMAAAQRLATATSIDLAVARAHSAHSQRRSAPIAKRIEIGPAGKRSLRTYVRLFLAIAHANDLRCDLAGNSTYVLAYGFESDIEVCEALYASLVVQMVRASDAFLRSGAHRQDMIYAEELGPDRRWRVTARPVHGTTARISFQSAFAARIGERLVAARDETTAFITGTEAHGASTQSPGQQSSGQQSSSTAVALTEKALEITDFYRETSTARGSWRGWESSGRTSSTADRAGRRAADLARTGTSAEIGGQARALP